MFFFRKKKIVINCFTKIDIPNFKYEPDYSRKFFPQWWKNLPKDNMLNGVREPTMKTCIGLIDYYNNPGIIIPCWEEISVSTSNNNSTVQLASLGEVGDVVYVNHEHRGGFMDHTQYENFKIISPWYFECEEDIKFLHVQPSWGFQNPDNFLIPPGIMRYKYQHSTNINFFLRRRIEQRNFIIGLGTPLIHIFPLSDRDIELKIHYDTEKEVKRLLSKFLNGASFSNRYRNSKKIQQDIETKQKCPFSGIWNKK
jgi:hypothetical protein